jgi:ATP-dependent DNA helicase RecG
MIADLAKDGKILQLAREAAKKLVTEDPDLHKEENRNLRNHINKLSKTVVNWSRIS